MKWAGFARWTGRQAECGSCEISRVEETHAPDSTRVQAGMTEKTYAISFGSLAAY